MSYPKLTPTFSYKFLILLISFLIPALLFTLWNRKIIILEAHLFSPSPSQPAISIVIDSIRLIFIFTVSLISFSVLKFASAYIASEPYISRFNTLVVLFIVSINLLILIPNIITLLLGWDGLGLISFLLVIYYQNPKSLAAGIITFLTNRIGDALIIIVIILIFDQANWNIIIIVKSPSSYMIATLIILAAITKSAQIPFSSWLPAAMAAPTPVSALVHSSTLVTAGVYLLIRFFPYISSSKFSCDALIILSCLTSIIAGFAALFETDIKKIIALSTLSQLGVIIISTSLHIPHLTFFHLITHAIFKALLFICAGTLIHSYFNNQDLRIFGNVSFSMPLTSLTISIANIALCGLPFLAGFYSKDAIIEASILRTSNFLIFALTIISTLLTAAYSVRISLFTLWVPALSSPIIFTSDNKANSYTSPIIILSTGAIFAGAIINWLFLAPLSQNLLPLNIKILPLIVTVLGGLLFINKTLSLKVSLNFPSPSKKDILINIWYLTPTSTKIMSSTFPSLRSLYLKINDHGWNEILGPQGLFSIFKKSSSISTLTSNPTLKINLIIILSLIILIYLF